MSGIAATPEQLGEVKFNADGLVPVITQDAANGDVLLFLVEQEGKGACHTGERTCFFRRFGADA